MPAARIVGSALTLMSHIAVMQPISEINGRLGNP